MQPEYSLQLLDSMEEIKLYLNSPNPDFNQGFGLFCKYSRNQSMMSYIGRKMDMTMLLYELQKMAQYSDLKENPMSLAHAARFNPNMAPVAVMPAAANTGAPDRLHIIDERTMNREDLPEELRTLYDQNCDNYKLLRISHEKMKNANSDLSRAEFRKEIIKLNESIRKNWAIIDRGIPDSLTQEEKQAAAINSARAYISKMLKKDVLTEDQRNMVISKVAALNAANAAIKPETLEKLKEKGF